MSFLAVALSCIVAVPASLAADESATEKPLARSSPPSSTAGDVVDDAGHHFDPHTPARRIITLAPHLTELVFAAGGGDRVVGIARYSDYPKTARSLPIVGDAFALNLEAIAALKPDLIVAWRTGMAQRQRDRIEALGLPIFESEIASVEGIADTLRRLGRIMGLEATSSHEADQLLARWSTLQKRYAGASPVRVFYQLSDDPLMTVNGEHLISRTMATCGGVNAFADVPALVPTISWESAARSNPQLIATATPPGRAPLLGRWPGLKQVDAVSHQQFAVLPPDLLSRMGPRFIEGAEALCEAIDKTRQTLPQSQSAQGAISKPSPARTQRQP